MKVKRIFYCLFSITVAGLVLFFLMAFLHPKVAEAQDTAPFQNVTINQGPDNPLVVIPDPPQANEPTELRVVLFNNSDSQITRYAQFLWTDFGIGLDRHPIAGRIPFIIPPQSEGATSIIWIPQEMRPYCFFVDIFDAPDSPNPIAVFQHNVFYQAHPNPNEEVFIEAFPYQLRNPLDTVASVVLSVTTPITPVGWEVGLYPQQIELNIGEVISAVVVFTYTGGLPLPPDGMRLFEVHAVANTIPIGGFQKVFGPPLKLHLRPEPGFAESEISVNPYPILPGEPAEICAEVRNVTQQPRQGFVFFRVAPFGIGNPFMPIAPPVEIFIPGMGQQRPCVHWVAPNGGQFAFEVMVETPGYPMPVSSQRVIDAGELLEPGSTSVLLLPVRNPLNEPVTITLGFSQIFMEGWYMTLSQDVLPSMAPGETRVVTMTVSPPADSVMPPDGSPVLDVEAFIGMNPIGGFRKIYHPPVPIHRPGDPIYAESEITVHPYPPQEREPTEICVELRNPTEQEQVMTVDFNVAGFGIGMPFHAIARPISVTLPPNSIKRVCITWVPPFGGRFGVEVGVQVADHERVYSQRFIDVGEILLPNQWSSPFEFPVGNPYPFTITVSLGAIRYLPQWEVTFDPTELVLPPGAIVPVVMHVLPVQQPGDPEPQEGKPVIDVEAYWNYNGQYGLLGGFRKLFFPPIPIHQPGDLPYAEREINIFPYPPHAGEPTHLEFVARNPTAETQQITVTFEVGNLGIGLPFTPIDVQSINLPPFQTGVIGTVWVPPFTGEFCVRVRVEAPFFTEPFYSARNISIVRLPEPYGTPEIFNLVVGDNGNTTRPLTITLGAILHLPNWQLSLDPTVIVMEPGQSYATAVMTLTPPADPAELPMDGDPVVDVEAYVNGNLIGGIHRVWRPPVPLGQLGEPSYAESEIVINPDPPVVDKPATFSAQVRNNSDLTQTISLQFGWADFGFGIPFSTTNVVPTQTIITLSPHMTTTVSAQWTPPYSDHFCVQIILTNAQTGEELDSQRNVDVIEVPEMQCESFIKEFWLQNSTPITVTVTLGENAINLPPGWTYSITPTETILAPYAGITATVTITPPCELNTPGWISGRMEDWNLSSPKLQVEGYDQNGILIGGIELQMTPVVQQPIYLPFVLHNNNLGIEGNMPLKSVQYNALGPTDRRIENPILVIILLMGGMGIYISRKFI
jgi:hypothetical protein